MQTFKPIYIYAQSLGNTSDDLMYQITSDTQTMVSQITELSTAQDIMSKMNAVAIDKNIYNHLVNLTSEIKDKYNIDKDFLIYNKDDQMLIKVNTNDKDELGRQSPILILLDLPYLQNDLAEEYIDYFYKGFMEFCRQTGRSPKHIDKAPLKALLLHLYQPKNKQKISQKTLKITLYIVAVIIALIVLWVLKSKLINE